MKYLKLNHVSETRKQIKQFIIERYKSLQVLPSKLELQGILRNQKYRTTGNKELSYSIV